MPRFRRGSRQNTKYCGSCVPNFYSQGGNTPPYVASRIARRLLDMVCRHWKLLLCTQFHRGYETKAHPCRKAFLELDSVSSQFRLSIWQMPNGTKVSLAIMLGNSTQGIGRACGSFSRKTPFMKWLVWLKGEWTNGNLGLQPALKVKRKLPRVLGQETSPGYWIKNSRLDLTTTFVGIEREDLCLSEQHNNGLYTHKILGILRSVL